MIKSFILRLAQYIFYAVGIRWIEAKHQTESQCEGLGGVAMLEELGQLVTGEQI